MLLLYATLTLSLLRIPQKHVPSIFRALKQMSEITQRVDTQPGAEGATPVPEKNGKVTKDDVFVKYAKTYQLVHLALHLLWLNFHIRLVGQLITNFIYGPWSPTNRKVVIIGDDLALGVGDWVMLGRTPGIQGRLNKVLNKDEASRIIGRGVLWTSMTCARAWRCTC